MTRYLLDTDILVFAIRGNQQVLARLSEIPVSKWTISSITAFEIQKGIQANPDSKSSFRATMMLNELEPEAFSTEAAIFAAKIHSALRARGLTIGTADELLAGHAIALGATLVSNNTKHFAAVPKLKLENWL